MIALKDIPVAILAGGLATRLRPLTEKVPKALLPIDGKPFLALQLESLKRQGIERVVLCVGYLGEQIKAQFGDGHSLGLKIEYSFDGQDLLGTGGALKRALPLLGERFFILYGDSYLTVPFEDVAKRFIASGKKGLMTAYRDTAHPDSNNMVLKDGKIVVYDKKKRLPEMEYIDYGLSMLSAEALDRIGLQAPFDLSAVMQYLIGEGAMEAFEVKDRYYEIGSEAGLAEVRDLFARGILGNNQFK